MLLGHKHLVNLILIDFCLESVVRVCKGGLGTAKEFLAILLFEDGRTRNGVCTVTVFDEHGQKHMVSLVLSDFCLEFVVGVCCGGLLTVARNPAFCFKIAGTRNGMHYPCTAEYKHVCEQRCYSRPPGICSKGLFRVLRCSIPHYCTFSLEPAVMKCPVLAGLALDRSN